MNDALVDRPLYQCLAPQLRGLPPLAARTPGLAVARRCAIQRPHRRPARQRASHGARAAKHKRSAAPAAPRGSATPRRPCGSDTSAIASSARRAAPAAVAAAAGVAPRSSTSGAAPAAPRSSLSSAAPAAPAAPPAPAALRGFTSIAVPATTAPHIPRPPAPRVLWKHAACVSRAIGGRPWGMASQRSERGCRRGAHGRRGCSGCWATRPRAAGPQSLRVGGPLTAAGGSPTPCVERQSDLE